MVGVVYLLTFSQKSVQGAAGVSYAYLIRSVQCTPRRLLLLLLLAMHRLDHMACPAAGEPELCGKEARAALNEMAERLPKKVCLHLPSMSSFKQVAGA